MEALTCCIFSFYFFVCQCRIDFYTPSPIKRFFPQIFHLHLFLNCKTASASTAWSADLWGPGSCGFQPIRGQHPVTWSIFQPIRAQFYSVSRETDHFLNKISGRESRLQDQDSAGFSYWYCLEIFMTWVKKKRWQRKFWGRIPQTNIALKYDIAHKNAMHFKPL